MKKKSILIFICAIALFCIACAKSNTQEIKETLTDETVETEETKVTEEIETESTQKASKEKCAEASLPFLSRGEVVPDNGSYPIIWDEIFVDLISFSVETNDDVNSFRLRPQALLAYAEEEKTDLSNDGLLDYFIMEKAKRFFDLHLENATFISGYNISSQEEVTIGEHTCTHYIGELDGAYETAAETCKYSFEAYCFNYEDHPIIIAGMLTRPDSDTNKDVHDTIRDDITNNLKRMVATVRTEK